MLASKPSDAVVCEVCGEDASGPGAAEVIKRHKAEKHAAKKKAAKKKAANDAGA